MNMKSAAYSLVLTVLLPGLAIAGPCQDDLRKVDMALEAKELPPDKSAQVEDMRNQAVQLCGAGNEQEGVDVLTEAKAMLSIE